MKDKESNDNSISNRLFEDSEASFNDKGSNSSENYSSITDKLKDADIEASFSDDGKNTAYPNRSCCSRYFGKIGEGSLRASIFNLAVLSLGVGSLSIPKQIGIMSLVLSPIIIFLAGLANLWTLILLSLISDKYKIYGYSDLVKKLNGKILSKFLDITIIVNVFGLFILYQVILYKLIGGIVNEIGKYGFSSSDEFLKKSFWKKKIYKFPVIYGVAFVVLLPLCSLKSVSKMRYASTFGLISFMTLISIIVLESPWYIRDYFKHQYVKKDKSTHLNIFDFKKVFTKDMKLLKAISTLFYAYTNHKGAFPVIKSLYKHNLRRVEIVYTRSIVSVFFAYMLIGICGYLSQPLKTPDLIIERRKLFHTDYIMLVGRLGMIFTLIIKIAINFNSMRISLLTIMNKDTVKIGSVFNWILCLITLGITAGIASLYQNISDYISLLGSFCSVLIAFFFPMMIYVKGNGYKVSHYKNILTIFFTSILCIIGFISGFFTIKGIIKKIKDK